MQRTHQEGVISRISLGSRIARDGSLVIRIMLSEDSMCVCRIDDQCTRSEVFIKCGIEVQSGGRITLS